MLSLLDPIVVGELHLPNRVIMAPLTRLRATADHVPTPLMRDYYVQRASAGLIISEGIAITPQAVGYACVSGLWNEAQVLGWRAITDGVHAAGGRIFAQLWHVGRISHSSFLDGSLPVSASAVRPAGFLSHVRPKTEFEVPRALTLEEVEAVIGDYAQAARNALAAGFDGVEIHGANGYLVDQFLQDSTNLRLDIYGGSLQNRARFLLSVADACVAVWGASRVGMHLAPRCDAHDMGDSDPAATFGYVATELGKRGLAFLCVREYHAKDRLGPALKKAFGGVYIANERYTRETANLALRNGEADAVAFGQLFIANPDLPIRFATGAPLNQPDVQTYYSAGSAGYTDYASVTAAGAQ